MSGDVFELTAATAALPVSVNAYVIAGRCLSVEALDDWAARWVTGFISGFHLHPVAAGAAVPAAITLRVRRAAPPAVPSGLQSFAVNHGVCYTDGAQYFLAVDESLVVVAAPAAQVVDVWFGLTPHAQHPVALVNVISYGLQGALRRAGVFDLHAAGAVDPAGRGALFVGTSGSGKSTLTLRLTVAGWSYLSDDMIVLRETGAGLEAEGLRRLFAVAAPSLAGCDLPRLAEALGGPVASDPNKRRLEPGVVFPDSFAAHGCRPAVLFFPEVTTAAVTSVEPLAPRAAMQQLLRHCPWATYDAQTAPDYLRVLARLARQCRAYRLLAGRDLLATPTRAAQLLAPYMNG